MFILFSCCIWHAIVSSVNNRVTAAVAGETTNSLLSTLVTEKFTTANMTRHTTRMIHTTSVTSTAGLALSTAKPSSTSMVTQQAQLADYIALGIFLTIYMVFHLIFGVLIFCVVTKLFNYSNIL
jgi:hypothetical protein